MGGFAVGTLTAPLSCQAIRSLSLSEASLAPFRAILRNFSCLIPFHSSLTAVPSQFLLRPFDIAVVLRLIAVPEDRYEPLAAALATSTSAVHRAVARLQCAGLCDRGTRTANNAAVLEFLVHGLRYAFPPVHGPERNGLPTAGAHPALIAALGVNAGPPLVWPMDGAAAHGKSLAPLFAGVTRVVQRDGRMHEMLAAIDLLRVGSGEQRVAASELLARYLTAD